MKIVEFDRSYPVAMREIEFNKKKLKFEQEAKKLCVRL